MGNSKWDGENRTLFETPDITNYQPWQTVVRGKRTSTVDMYIAQFVQQENKSAPLDRKDVAQVLHKGTYSKLQNLSNCHQVVDSADSAQ